MMMMMPASSQNRHSEQRVDMDAVKSSAGMCLWMMLSFAGQTASSQVEVQAFVGQDVLLPCSFPGVVGDLRPERVNVSWKNHGDQEVLAIDGVQNLTQQHSAFRGRVTSFPNLYPQGNFSIVLRDVQPLDGGLYECHMVVDFRQRVQLGVTGKQGPPPTSGGAVLRPNSLRVTLLSVPLLLSLLWPMI